ncbi:MAG: hypothetical protein JJU26_11835 [Oceanicaulis sp.]|uniref:DUF4330 domain-containing protein n=1 Tax=Glycocaulis sp. TaxID=1969725 RepID=UPI0025C5FD28|nr:DUF4330 domain-containing protein [Glycocaulis sp.]MCC5982396.1 hypothetical protein [Oceanicaulis sp.]MCH8521584.1 DUF4330 domain-containing protein [Glycocaulis sp.]
MSRRPFLSRTHRAREARNRQRMAADPGGTMRLAVLVALVLVALAVAAGFRGEETAREAGGWLARLGPLAEPRIFGASILEIGAILAVLAVCALILWRRR